MSVKVVVIDDERLARKELIKLLSVYQEMEVVGEASDAEEGIALIEKLKPDCIFLDIQMPGKNGFDMLAELDVSPMVVFVTAFDEFAIKAFEVHAEDYLLKPVEQDKLDVCVKKILSSNQEDEDDLKPLSKKKLLYSDDYVFLKDGEKSFFVKLNEIILFQSEGNYVKVFFNDNKILILRSLNALEERLDPYLFFRANRKHLVNLDHVDRVEVWFNGGLMLHLKGGIHKIEVSRRQAMKFKDVYSL